MARWWSAGASTDGSSHIVPDQKVQQSKMRANQRYIRRWWRCGSNMHEEMYWRSRLSSAFRTGWACLMAGLILHVGSMHVQWVTFPIFGYVMAVTVVGESTVGKAMQDALAIATGTLQGVGMSLVVLQLLPPARCFHNIGMAITCISVSAFFTTLPKAFPTTNVLQKRVVLAHTAIIYITATVQRESMDRIFFPLRLAGTTIVGTTCGVLALLLPFPRLAIFQVRSQTKLSTQISSEQLKVLVDAFSATDTARASAFMLQAKALARIAASVASEITSIEDDVGWEAKRFPCRHSHSLQQVTQGLSPLQKSLVGLELALQAEFASSSRHNKQRFLLGRLMRDALVYVTDWVCLALKYASTDIKQPSPASHAHRQVIIEEGNEVLSSFHEALSNTHQQLGYTLATEEFQLNNDMMDKIHPDASQSTGSMNEENHADVHVFAAYSPHHNDADHESNSDSEMVETICNAAREQLEYRIAASDLGREDESAVLGDFPTGHNFHPVYGRRVETSMINHAEESSCDGLHLASNLKPRAKGALLDCSLVGDQAAASFFLFNVEKLVQGTIHILEGSNLNVLPKALVQPSKVLQVKVVASPSDAQNPQFEHTSENRKLVCDPNCLHYLPTSDANPRQPAPTDENPPHRGLPLSTSSASLPHNSPVQKLCRECSANSSSAMLKVMNRKKANHLLAGFKALELHSEQLRTAFKMSVAMAIGGFLGFWFNNRKGYWADITLALGFTGVAKGGSFKIAVLRTLGTVSGSVYGLLVVLSTFNFPVLRLIALVPWVVFTSFLRKSKILGNAGAVSAFTGAIVILARTNKDSTDQEFTVIRIVEAFLGMASFLVVEMLVLPRRAASLVKPNIVSGLGNLQELVSAIFGLISNEHCQLCRGSKAIDELKRKEKKLRRRISSQNQLVKEAAEEPQLWLAPFLDKMFSKVVEEQANILELLHFSIIALEEVQCVAEQAKVPMDKLVQAPLKAAMSMMEEKVVPTLAFLGKALAQETIPMQDAPHDQKSSIATAKYSHHTDQGHKFVDLGSSFSSSLMMSDQSTTTNSRSSVLEFVNVQAAQQAESRGFMEAFHVACELAALEAMSTSSPTNPSSCSSCGQDVAAATAPCARCFANTLFLSLGTLAFAVNGLLHHTTQLEKVVHELLQAENPWTLIQFWDTSKSLRHLQ